LEYSLTTLIIFLLWIIPDAYDQIRDIHWIALLVTGICLGLVMVGEYFMQQIQKLAVKLILFKSIDFLPSSGARSADLCLGILC
jgi:hypothetical protein